MTNPKTVCVGGNNTKRTDFDMLVTRRVTSCFLVNHAEKSLFFSQSCEFNITNKRSQEFISG